MPTIYTHAPYRCLPHYPMKWKKEEGPGGKGEDFVGLMCVFVFLRHLKSAHETPSIFSSRNNFELKFLFCLNLKIVAGSSLVLHLFPLPGREYWGRDVTTWGQEEAIQISNPFPLTSTQSTHTHISRWQRGLAL